MARLLRRLLSKVDAMVARVENHEGLVECALGDERERLGRVQRELDGARSRGVGLDEAWRDAVEQQAKWRDRAKNEVDESMALECLRMSKHARARAAELSEQCHQQAELQRRLEAIVVRLSERLLALEGQRELMQTRQHDAPHVDVGPGALVETDVQALLARWETTVQRSEYDRSWLAEEEAQRTLAPLADDDAFLKLELDELRRENK